jgi:hypothetical protein
MVVTLLNSRLTIKVIKSLMHSHFNLILKLHLKVIIIEYPYAFLPILGELVNLKELKLGIFYKTIWFDREYFSKEGFRKII